MAASPTTRAPSVRPPPPPPGDGKYTAESISSLSDAEHVRLRAAMYIGDTAKSGYHHLLWEIVDNSVDEVMNGHATRIVVTLEADGKTISVADNGRGIPVDKHPKTGRSALEVIFTVLHAGGKFDNDAYKVSGGLHGVGASVVNALSSELTATVRRDGRSMIYAARFDTMNALLGFLTENCCSGAPCAPVAACKPARKRVKATV